MVRRTHQDALQTEHSTDSAIQARLVLMNVVTDAGEHLPLHHLRSTLIRLRARIVEKFRSLFSVEVVGSINHLYGPHIAE